MLEESIIRKRDYRFQIFKRASQGFRLDSKLESLKILKST